MINVVLHSDQINGNTVMDEAALKLFFPKNPAIAYIPSQTDSTKEFYNQKLKYYKNIGINNLVYHDLDKECDKDKLNK